MVDLSYYQMACLKWFVCYLNSSKTILRFCNRTVLKALHAPFLTEKESKQKVVEIDIQRINPMPPGNYWLLVVFCNCLCMDGVCFIY